MRKVYRLKHVPTGLYWVKKGYGRLSENGSLFSTGSNSFNGMSPEHTISLNINDDKFPFWIIFEGDITRDPCRVREITYWFDQFVENYFFWRDTTNPDPLIEHFVKYIAPMLD